MTDGRRVCGPGLIPSSLVGHSSFSFLRSRRKGGMCRVGGICVYGGAVLGFGWQTPGLVFVGRAGTSLRVMLAVTHLSSSKGQTHREVGAQSYGPPAPLA